MPRRATIPPALAHQPFTTTAALAQGLSHGDLRSRTLQRPFHGVRSVGLDLERLEDRCRAYSVTMPAAGMFSHETAARLWDLPLPFRFGDDFLHVTVPAPGRAPRGAKIRGHRSFSASAVPLRDLRVTNAVDTWLDLASRLEVPDLVAIGDYLVTGDPYNNVLPLAAMDELRVATATRRGTAGYRRQAAALALVVEGPLSRPESLVRLLLLEAGIPVPQVNRQVVDAGGSFVAIPDLRWPEWKVALEYEGDLHRGKERFRQDIRRIEKLVDHGWLVIKVSADDLFERPHELVARVARRLESRGWSGRGIRLPQSVHNRR